MIKPLIKTPISYYGGKQAIVNHLLAMVPPHEVYTEVFFGGGTLFWAKKPAKNETINDRLDIVINFYRVLKTDFAKLKKEIDATLFSRTQHLQALAIIKGARASKVKRAWAFWMCANFSFMNKLNGGIKYSNDVGKAEPYVMRNKKASFTDLLVYRIETTTIENNDFRKILKSRNSKKAFHYLDNPFIGTDPGHYNQIQSFEPFTENDFIDMLDICQNLKGNFLISEYSNPILETYTVKNGWFVIPIGERRNNRTEVLVSNYKSPCGTLDLFENHKSKIINTQCG